MDIVFIESLEVETVIGVYDWERTIHQCLIIDLQMGWDNQPAALGDDITLALDYAAVSARIQSFAQQASYQLVETFAEDLSKALLAEYKLPWLRLKITKKGAVKEASGVGVEIERGCRQ